MGNQHTQKNVKELCKCREKDRNTERNIDKKKEGVKAGMQKD